VGSHAKTIEKSRRNQTHKHACVRWAQPDFQAYGKPPSAFCTRCRYKVWPVLRQSVVLRGNRGVFSLTKQVQTCIPHLEMGFF
jgi:hypothetical protein